MSFLFTWFHFFAAGIRSFWKRKSPQQEMTRREAQTFCLSTTRPRRSGSLARPRWDFLSGNIFLLPSPSVTIDHQNYPSLSMLFIHDMAHVHHKLWPLLCRFLWKSLWNSVWRKIGMKSDAKRPWSFEPTSSLSPPSKKQRVLADQSEYR